MKKVLASFLIGIMTLGQVSCASIVSGKSQDLSIHSEPAGAEVYIDDVKLGTSPMITKVKRKKRHTIKFTKDGYNSEIRTTSKGFNWWFCGNLILGGVIGIIVDFATGAVYEVKPQSVTVAMQKA